MPSEALCCCSLEAFRWSLVILSSGPSEALHCCSLDAFSWSLAALSLDAFSWSLAALFLGPSEAHRFCSLDAFCWSLAALSSGPSNSEALCYCYLVAFLWSLAALWSTLTAARLALSLSLHALKRSSRCSGVSVGLLALSHSRLLLRLSSLASMVKTVELSIISTLIKKKKIKCIATT